MLAYLWHTISQPHFSAMPEEQLRSDYRVTIDERIMEALDRKRPIGLSRTAWINLLLQQSIVEQPERIDAVACEF